MTSTILIDASTAPVAAGDHVARKSRPAGPAPRLTTAGVLRSEWIKLASLRSIRVTILVTVLAGLGFSAMIGMLWSGELTGAGTTPDPAALEAYLLTVSTASASFLALVFGVLGVFAVASEYSSGMILSTLTAVPRRTPVAIAKMVVLATISAITALTVVVGGLGIAALCLPAAGPSLLAMPVVSGVLGTIVYLVLFALFAAGIAGLLRSTAGGIAVVAGVAFVLPIGFQVLSLTGWEWVPVAAQYLPSSLGAVISQGMVDVASGPTFWGALGAMLAWAVVVLIPALLGFLRRDAR
ncbi:ABC transporter permease [Leucobacter rhizosphaerae]|uniref:ABC transporter permease n=1 Tax=Leucobacter rhizosphaerae TaxID=2932245 RepID=A0ABY4FWS1_9MICO|nr:ABC transporter permease [Leucobacter rhizosphaerae]UOQ60739.1 ABC transporter permease [Leucobacter rhizosphaerae]